MTAVDIVLIGRNEALRLPAVLIAASGTGARVIYVDSGSTDLSREIATARGVTTVPLDMSVPFTAARARNAGAAALVDPAPFLHFLDGDCVLEPGWMDAALAFLHAHPDHALVTGWIAEERPDVSVYNRLIDWEWHAAPGRIEAATGNMLVRRAAFEAVGGFDPRFIASEEEEFCTRLIAEGWALERLPRTMARHDADMTRLGQWWRRTERAGHGLAQLGRTHPGRGVAERRRAWVYGGAIPLTALVLFALAPWAALLVLLAYPWTWWNGYRALRRDGIAQGDARKFAALFTLAKLPTLIGMLRYHLRRLAGRDMTLIEYRGPGG
ncbi:glycosyltransferase family 2 protein [Roseivivax sp. CAU 1753]